MRIAVIQQHSSGTMGSQLEPKSTCFKSIFLVDPQARLPINRRNQRCIPFPLLFRRRLDDVQHMFRRNRLGYVSAPPYLRIENKGKERGVF